MSNRTITLNKVLDENPPFLRVWKNDGDLSLYLRYLKITGHKKLHESIRSGYLRRATVAISHYYDGRFGKGICVIYPNSRDSVSVHYYIKEGKKDAKQVCTKAQH